MALDGTSAKLAERLVGDRAGDVGVAVAIAADPVAESKPVTDPIAVGAWQGKRLPQILGDARHHIPERPHRKKRSVELF